MGQTILSTNQIAKVARDAIVARRGIIVKHDERFTCEATDLVLKFPDKDSVGSRLSRDAAGAVLIQKVVIKGMVKQSTPLDSHE